MENANVVVKFAMQVPCVEDSPQAERKKWEYLPFPAPEFDGGIV